MSDELCRGSEQLFPSSPPRALAASGSAAGRTEAQPCPGLVAPVLSGRSRAGSHLLGSSLLSPLVNLRRQLFAAGLDFCACRGSAGARCHPASVGAEGKVDCPRRSGQVEKELLGVDVVTV